MAVNNISSTLRLTGMSSGMDTDSIITNLMKIEQLKVDRQVRARTQMEWKQTALNDVTKDIKAFRETFMSALSSKNIFTEAAYKIYNTTTSGAAAGAVTVSAGYKADAGNYTIRQVKQLAASASATSDQRITTENGGALNLDKRLDEVVFANGEKLNLFDVAQAKDADGNLMFKDAEGKTVFQDADGKYFYKNAEGKPATNEEGAAVYYTAGEINGLEATMTGKFSLSINGKEFTFDRSTTLNNVMKQINASDANVNMKYSELTGKFTISSNETGEDKTLSFGNSGENGNFFDLIGVAAKDETDPYRGKDSIVVFEDRDGNAVEYKNAKNAYSLDGLSYTLNRTTTEAEGKIHINVARDIDSTVDKIKEFVNGYNTLIQKLEGMLTERKSSSESSYTPLTEEEKSAMTEKQVEEWEAIAKKGLLYNDSNIRGMISTLRDALFETVSGTGLSPSSIGLKTGSYLEGKRGEIVLDEDALRAALEKNPDEVMRVFTQTSQSADSATAKKESGLLNRIYDAFSSYSKSQAISLDSIGRSIKDVKDKIYKLETKMLETQERYYQKFAAMETAMSKLNSQSDWLAGALGGL